ncbi:MAG: hypothetical protein JNM31_01360 [Flavobacteriales bacterium]|nr:hypothetical protein [Flavobacteriales bacterium]
MLRWRVTASFILLALAQASALQGSAYPYRGEPDSGPLGHHLSVLTDPTGAMELEDVLRAPGWEQVTKGVPNLGLSDHWHWVRLDVEQLSREDMLYLLVGNPEIDELDIHLVSGDIRLKLASAGLKRPSDQLARSGGDLSYGIPIPPGGRASIFLRVRSAKQLQLPLSLHTKAHLVKGQHMRNLFTGGYIGIMLVMMLYNLFVFLSIRDRSYLVYVIYIALVCLAQLTFLGFGPIHLWPNASWFAPHASLLFTAMTAIAASEFMRRFLQTSQYLPGFDNTRMLFYVLFALGMALQFGGFAIEAYKTVQVVSAAFATYILLGAYQTMRKGFRPAIFFLIAWSLFLVGITMFVLKDWGLLPFNDVTKYTMPVGSAVEVVLLSFGLADKINILRREKEESQAAALLASQLNEKMIREQNVVLEQKVNERTLELRESNDHLKRTQSQLVNAEKMASLGQLTAGIAHEINNPVNFISSNIPPLRRNLEDMLDLMLRYRSLQDTLTAPEIKAIAEVERQYDVDVCIAEIKEMLNSIEEGASRTAAIVRGLRNFSRLDEDDLKHADLHEGIRSTLTVLGSQLRDRADIQLDFGDLPEVECYPGKLNQVVMNVLTNAVQAVAARFHSNPGEGRVVIRTCTQGDDAVIAIKDNGPGMPEHVKQRIFEPFFTTKDVGEGTGLGLSIAYSIMEKHGGRIEVDSMPGEGTEFRLILPIRAVEMTRKRA